MSGHSPDASTVFRQFRLTDDGDLRRLRHALPSPVDLIHHPESLPLAFEVTVIGDIRVDVRGALPDQRFVDMSEDTQTRAPLNADVGGTAIGFARAAGGHFAGVHLIGALGQDPWTDYIRERVEEEGIDARISEVEVPNSLVVVLRDEPTEDLPQGVRMVVSDTETPYGRLDAAKIRAQRRFIERADALVVDGYALLEDSTAEAVDVATELAVAAGVPVCFDIVPHRIDQFATFDQIKPILHRSSMITTEAHTLLRLLGRELPEEVTPEFAADLVASLPLEVSGWQRTWLIRYGVGNMDETTAVSPSHHAVTYRTGYAQAEEVGGYGYLVSAAELKWWLTNYTRAAAVYPRLAARSELVTAKTFRTPKAAEGTGR